MMKCYNKLIWRWWWWMIHVQRHCTTGFPTLRSFPFLFVDSINIGSPIDKKHHNKVPQLTEGNERHKDDIQSLGFRECEKVDETSNVILTLVVTITIANYSVWRILIDDMSSWDPMYIGIFLRLGFRNQHLKLYDGGSLLKVNDSSTLSRGTIDLQVSFGERMKELWMWISSWS